MANDFDPQQVPRLRTVLSSCSPEIRNVAKTWLSYTVFYWLFPTLVVILGFWIGKKPVKWMDLLIHGEFLIYAVTIVAGSTRLIAKDLPPARPPFVNRQVFNLVSHVMIFPAIFIYGLVRYIGLTSDPYSVNQPLVMWYSLILLVCAFGFSYVVFLIDAQRSSPYDIPMRAAAAIAQSQDNLDNAFDKLVAQEETATEQRASGASTEQPEPIAAQAAGEVVVVEAVEENGIEIPRDKTEEDLGKNFDAVRDDK